MSYESSVLAHFHEIFGVFVENEYPGSWEQLETYIQSKFKTIWEIQDGFFELYYVLLKRQS